ncbi:MAG: gamma-glutamylcyclotransferase, partial [Thiohalophilus sp.]
PSGKDSLDGTLYFDLEPLLHKKIDHYEDTCYEKQEVEVVTEEDETVIAMAYVIPENKRLLLSSIPWDQQQFIQEHMDNFLRYIR